MLCSSQIQWGIYFHSDMVGLQNTLLNERSRIVRRMDVLLCEKEENSERMLVFYCIIP